MVTEDNFEIIQKLSAYGGKNNMTKERTQFCIECRKETGYKIRIEQCTHCIKGQKYTFNV